MATPLIYYNPNVATHERNHHLPGIALFSKFFKIFNSTVVCIDRTNTIRVPIRVESLFPMPTFRHFTKTFEEICNERAQELLQRADSLNIPLNVFWSGGIDSTLLLISFLKMATPAQKENIVVRMTEESITENPLFYKEYIFGKLKTDSSAMFMDLLGSKNLLVGGEHNDQLFGSDIVAQMIAMFGPTVIKQSYSRNTFFTFLNAKLSNDQDTANRYLDLFECVKNAAPIPITSNFEFLWWINFSLKWQSVFMRMLSFATDRSVKKIDREYIQTRYVHFYGTDDFQLWSMNNLDKKIGETWSSYKWICKEIIYDFNKDALYRDTKNKKGSLFFLLLQQTPFDFIDTSLHMYRHLDASEYYNPDNDFI